MNVDYKKIDDFKGFMDNNFKKLLSIMIIEIFSKKKIRTGFFKKEIINKKTTYKIYFTPFKKIIKEIILNDKPIVEEDLPFKINDNISKAEEWAKLNNYNYYFKNKKTNI